MSHGARGTRGKVKPAIGVVAVVGALALTACGDSDAGSTSPATTTGAAGSGGRPADIAYLTYTIADYQTAMVDGMKRKVAPAGGSVTVLNANFDPQKQQQQCNDAVQSGRYDAIVLGAVDNATAVPCVTVARAADIPVITIEIAAGEDPNQVEPQLEGNVKAILTPPASNAKGLAELTKLACEGQDPCEVIAEIATPSDRLTNAVVDEIPKVVPNAKVVQKIATQYDPAAIAKALPDALSSHPGADVVVTAADFQALAAIPPVKSSGKLDQVKIIGNGGSRSGVAAVADGRIFGTLGTWPFQMGELAGTAAIEAVNGQPISGPAGLDAFELDTPSLVTQDNVAEFQPEWGAK